MTKNKIKASIISPDALVPQADFEITLTGYTQYPDQPRSLVIHKTDAVGIGEILDAMGDFLSGMGFIIDGHLEVVPDE